MEKTIEVCTEVSDTTTAYAMNETFDTASDWTGTGYGTTSYPSGTLRRTFPASPSEGEMHVHKSFTTGEGLHTVSFDIVGNSCGYWMHIFGGGMVWVTSDIQVRILDQTDNIVASNSYSATGSYSMSFTPSSSGSTYKIRFHMSNASLLCAYSLDNIVIAHNEVNTDILCENVPLSYKYGFQNQEKDDEIKGAGNSVNYTYRMHDTRLGRFFAVDPLASKYPHNSPYAFSENRVIDAIELEGLERFLIRENPAFPNVKILTVTDKDVAFEVIDEQGNKLNHFKYKSLEYQMEGWESLPNGGIKVPNVKKNYYTLQGGSLDNEYQNPETTFTIHNFGNNELNTIKHVPKSSNEDSPLEIFERVSPSHGAVVKNFEAPESSTDVKYDLDINYMRSGYHGHEKNIKISVLDAKGNLLVSGGLDDKFEFNVGSKENFSIRVEYSGSIDKMADVVIQGNGITTKEVVDNDYNK